MQQIIKNNDKSHNGFFEYFVFPIHEFISFCIDQNSCNHQNHSNPLRQESLAQHAYEIDPEGIGMPLISTVKTE